MSLLTNIQNICAELSLTVPNSVMSSTDQTILQLRILAQRAGDDLCRDHDWSDLKVASAFTATGVNPEPSEPPSDWQAFSANSRIWNMSRLWTMNGPVDAMTWQRNLAISTNPVPQIWRMSGGKLEFLSNVAGETISYEYQSTNWIIAATGTTKSAWTDDTDICRLPDRLLELSLIWRWKRAKGLDYAEEMANFMLARESEIGSDRAASAFSLAKPNRGQVPDSWWPGSVAVS